MSTMLDCALRYAQMGWRVLPLRGKAPLTKNGSKDASLDESRIRGWWTKWPKANIGLATGYQFFVLDLDSKNGGVESWESLRAKYGGASPATPEQVTGGGGRQILFALPDFPVRNSQGTIAPGVDIRGIGGYVVAPPSVHPTTKRRYAWDGTEKLENQTIAPAPGWLLALIRGTEKNRPVRFAEKIPKGVQHSTLVSIAGTMRRRGMSADEIFAALQVVNNERCTEPGPIENIRKIADSITKYAPVNTLGEQRWPNDPVLSPPNIPLGEEIGSRDLIESTLLADAGNATRFILKYGEDVRYCFERGTWFIWNGKIWAEDTQARAWVMAEHVMVDTLHQADAAQDDVTKKWALKSLNERGIHGLLKSAMGKLPVSVSMLDQHPDLLVFRNGTVDLRTGALGAHERLHFITKLVDCDYLPGQGCPFFLRWLATTMGGDGDASEGELDRACRKVDFLQTAIGYSATGHTSEKKVFFPTGPSNSGKSTLMVLLYSMWGKHATKIDVKSLMDLRNNGNAKDDIADLFGVRFAIASETAEGQRLDEAGVKLITQGAAGVIKTARKYEHHIQFQESHKLWVESNFKPVIRSTDDSIWKRLVLIPFERVVPDQDIDRDLLPKLLAETPGIWAWVIRGSRRWYESGKQLLQPPEVKAALKEYRSEMDSVGQFLEDCCLAGAQQSVSSTNLYKAYYRWAQSRGESHPMTHVAFSLRLKNRAGIEIEHTRKGSIVHGIALLAGDESR